MCFLKRDYIDSTMFYYQLETHTIVLEIYFITVRIVMSCESYVGASGSIHTTF